MIDDETWQAGYDSLFLHYGPDVGGQEEEYGEYGEYEQDYQDEQDGESRGDHGRYFPSDEFVYNSDSD